MNSLQEPITSREELLRRLQSLGPSRKELYISDRTRKAIEASIGESLTLRCVQNEKGEFYLIQDPYPSPD